MNTQNNAVALVCCARVYEDYEKAGEISSCAKSLEPCNIEDRQDLNVSSSKLVWPLSIPRLFTPDKAATPVSHANDRTHEARRIYSWSFHVH